MRYIWKERAGLGVGTPSWDKIRDETRAQGTDGERSETELMSILFLNIKLVQSSKMKGSGAVHIWQGQILDSGQHVTSQGSM